MRWTCRGAACGLCGAAAAALLAVAAQMLLAAHARLEALPQPFSLAELTAPLRDAERVSVPVAGPGLDGRSLSVLASPPGSSGKTVVLVHGFKMSAESWSPTWNELRGRGHRVVAVDLPGHGASGFTPEAIGLEALCDDLRAALDHLEVSEGALVGHSLGGFLAIRYLLDHPAHAARRLPLGFACVACTAGDWPTLVGGKGGNWHGDLLMSTGLFDLLMASDWVAPLLMAKKFGRGAASRPAVQVVVEASRRGASRAALRSMSDFAWTHNLHPEIPGISLPSIVIVGALDDHHPHPLMSEALRRDFAATGMLRAYVVLPDAGHFLPLLQPTETADAVERLWGG